MTDSQHSTISFHGGVQERSITTGATDWLGRVANQHVGQEADLHRQAAIEAARWMQQVSPIVHGHVEEMTLQANNWGRRWASKFGEQASFAMSSFLQRAAHLIRTAAPDSVHPEDETPNDYDDYFEEDRRARVRYEHEGSRRTAFGGDPNKWYVFGTEDDAPVSNAFDTAAEAQAWFETKKDLIRANGYDPDTFYVGGGFPDESHLTGHERRSSKTAERQCSACDGTGRSENARGDDVACHYCRGTGTRKDVRDASKRTARYRFTAPAATHTEEDLAIMLRDGRDPIATGSGEWDGNAYVWVDYDMGDEEAQVWYDKYDFLGMSKMSANLDDTMSPDITDMAPTTEPFNAGEWTVDGSPVVASRTAGVTGYTPNAVGAVPGSMCPTPDCSNMSLEATDNPYWPAYCPECRYYFNGDGGFFENDRRASIHTAKAVVCNSCGHEFTSRNKWSVSCPECGSDNVNNASAGRDSGGGRGNVKRDSDGKFRSGSRTAMFPGPHADVDYNEDGEPMGWSDTTYDGEYDQDDFYDQDDDMEHEASMGRGARLHSTAASRRYQTLRRTASRSTRRTASDLYTNSYGLSDYEYLTDRDVLIEGEIPAKILQVGRDAIFNNTNWDVPNRGPNSFPILVKIQGGEERIVEFDSLAPLPNNPSFASRRTASRPIYEIAADIRRAWGSGINYAAKPYLDAMLQINSIDDTYGYDSARGIVAYFLSNASGFRGDQAKALKAELKALGSKTATHEDDAAGSSLPVEITPTQAPDDFGMGWINDDENDSFDDASTWQNDDSGYEMSKDAGRVAYYDDLGPHFTENSFPQSEKREVARWGSPGGKMTLVVTQDQYGYNYDEYDRNYDTPRSSGGLDVSSDEEAIAEIEARINVKRWLPSNFKRIASRRTAAPGRRPRGVVVDLLWPGSVIQRHTDNNSLGLVVSRESEGNMVRLTYSDGTSTLHASNTGVSVVYDAYWEEFTEGFSAADLPASIKIGSRTAGMMTEVGLDRERYERETGDQRPSRFTDDGMYDDWAHRADEWAASNKESSHIAGLYPDENAAGVTTWADGYGNWHATADSEEEAKWAIQRELEARGEIDGQNYEVQVELVDGRHYVEASLSPQALAYSLTARRVAAEGVAGDETVPVEGYEPGVMYEPDEYKGFGGADGAADIDDGDRGAFGARPDFAPWVSSLQSDDTAIFEA